MPPAAFSSASSSLIATGRSKVEEQPLDEPTRIATVSTALSAPSEALSVR
jgi:hypothetical protein